MLSIAMHSAAALQQKLKTKTFKRALIMQLKGVKTHKITWLKDIKSCANITWPLDGGVGSSLDDFTTDGVEVLFVAGKLSVSSGEMRAWTVQVQIRRRCCTFSNHAKVWPSEATMTVMHWPPVTCQWIRQTFTAQETSDFVIRIILTVLILQTKVTGEIL